MWRGDLSEAEWRVLKALLPIEAANRGRGRRPERNRSIINGILWRLYCGAPRHDVPPRLRPKPSLCVPPGNRHAGHKAFR
ncbi:MULTISPECIES: transposase [Acetobacteraceae]|uniref:transposase n=1 Tax=Acetobacteraceae TaxID=433 RepID=UPI00351C8315